jgi:glycine dehydrogenase
MPTPNVPASQLDADSFVPRHIGPNDAEIAAMAKAVGFDSLDALIDATVPDSIRLKRPLAIARGKSETEALRGFREVASRNKVYRSFIGLGYYNCLTPPVIQRNILENPAWYTAYTPYQSEIAQGRLEALLNFQTAVIDLTGLEIANASLLDEGTSAAEAMHMAYALRGGSERATFLVSEGCFPQTSIVCARARRRAGSVSSWGTTSRSRSRTRCSACLFSIRRPAARSRTSARWRRPRTRAARW